MARMTDEEAQRLAAIAADEEALAYVPSDYWQDGEFCLAAVRINGWALKYIAESRQTPEIKEAAYQTCLVRLRNHETTLSSVPITLRTPELYLVAMEANEKALLHVPSEYWEDRAFCLQALKHCRDTWKPRVSLEALVYIPDALWKDSAFCLQAVKTSGEALSFIPKQLITAELCLAAVKQDGSALKWVPKEHMSEAIFLEAVKNSGTAVRYVPRLRLTKAIVAEAVGQTPAALASVPDEWREEAKAALDRK